MDGQPVADANIFFSPTGGGADLRAAMAKTDAQGKFTMMTLEPEDGLSPGDFTAIVVKNEPFGPEPKPERDEQGNEYTPLRPTKNVLPEKFASVATSGLKFTIPPEGNKNLEIVLKK